MTQLYIKNMVCDRCIMAVRHELDQMGINYTQIQLGQVELKDELPAGQLEAFKTVLSNLGFELLDSKNSKIVEQIKNSIVAHIQGYNDEGHNRKLSVVLQEKLQKDYHYLTTLFSAVEGVTIEKYVILQRIEKVKELLMYDEMNLSEISWQLGYSSVQHLSQQFKKTTGFTPSEFKALKDKKRTPLDKI